VDRTLYRVDAFAEAPGEGNPAAVCPVDAWPTDAAMQALAAQINLSETAFYLARPGRLEIRWFTPSVEVDLCGHATLAAAHVAFARGDASGERAVFASRSGPLGVAREGDALTLDFPALAFDPCAVPAALAEGLGATPDACFSGMDYLAVFADARAVAGLAPDFRRLAELPLRGVIATAPAGDCDFVSRFFAPNAGIDEDPVTGSAHCALAPYWAARLGKKDLEARQISARGGRLRCRVRGDRVLVSGRARDAGTETVHLPPTRTHAQPTP
jgi:PhzF family phenazine biosynthesis protein